MYLSAVIFILFSLYGDSFSMHCGDLVIDLASTPFASIKSPGYPAYYAGAQSCAWKISTKITRAVKATCFIDLPNTNCAQDNLVFNSAGSNPQFCNLTDHVTFTSSSNNLNITLNGSVKGRFTCNLVSTGLFGVDNCNCGIMNKPPTTTRIINGTVTEANQFPSLVKIIINNGNKSCGGTIISDRIILTAANCVDGIVSPKNFKVWIGGYSTVIIDYGKLYDVDRIIFHGEYNRTTRQNDIALMIISPQILFGRDASPACLPFSSDLSGPGDLLTAVGWGETSNQGKNSVIPRQVTIPQAAGLYCGLLYPQVYDQVKSICVSTWDNKGPCQGDTGGAYFAYIESEQALVEIGIISYNGLGGCASGFPSIGTNVNQYLDWILQNSPAYSSFCGI